MNKEKKPLYRKRNTHLIGEYVYHGAKYSWERSKHKNDFDTTWLPMSTDHGADYDYRPLERYLEKAVGRNWNDVYSEILPRLPKGREGQDAIEMYVTRNLIDEYHGFYVDENNILQYRDYPNTVNSFYDYNNHCWEYHYKGEPYEVCFPSISEYFNRFKDNKDIKKNRFRVFINGYDATETDISNLGIPLKVLLLRYGNVRDYKIEDYWHTFIKISITDKDVVNAFMDEKRKNDKILKKRAKKAARYPKHRKPSDEEAEGTEEREWNE